MSNMKIEKVEQLSPRVRRIVANNGNVMTGPGTNTYILGQEKIAVIDPGPDDDKHIANILDIVGDKLYWVFVTHTHPDHSPAAAKLVAATGAEMVGSVMVDDGHQDQTFEVHRNILHEERFETAEFTLHAIHTPGHVSNHICYLLEEESLLFTGDHIMNGATVVIIPPSGDMLDYLSSLDVLKSYNIKNLAPGHGDIMAEPNKVIDSIIQHRLAREKKVLDNLAQLKKGTIEDLTPHVYDDVDPYLHPVAHFSLWAHLIKLEKEGLVIKHGEKHWAFGGEQWIYVGRES